MKAALAFCASAVVLLMGCGTAKGGQTKPVVMQQFPTSNEAIYDRWKGKRTYGEPKEILAILSQMRVFCSRRSVENGILGLPPAKDVTLVQVGQYAMLDGACGDRALHSVLILAGPEATWESDACTWHRTVKATPLHEILASKDGCWIANDILSRMLLVRSGTVQAYCAAEPQSDVLCPGFRYDAADLHFIQTLHEIDARPCALGCRETRFERSYRRS